MQVSPMHNRVCTFVCVCVWGGDVCVCIGSVAWMAEGVRVEGLIKGAFVGLGNCGIWRVVCVWGVHGLWICVCVYGCLYANKCPWM